MIVMCEVCVIVAMTAGCQWRQHDEREAEGDSEANC